MDNDDPPVLGLPDLPPELLARIVELGDFSARDMLPLAGVNRDLRDTVLPEIQQDQSEFTLPWSLDADDFLQHADTVLGTLNVGPGNIRENQASHVQLYQMFINIWRSVTRAQAAFEANHMPEQELESLVDRYAALMRRVVLRFGRLVIEPPTRVVLGGSAAGHVLLEDPSDDRSMVYTQLVNAIDQGKRFAQSFLYAFLVDWLSPMRSSRQLLDTFQRVVLRDFVVYNEFYPPAVQDLLRIYPRMFDRLPHEPPGLLHPGLHEAVVQDVQARLPLLVDALKYKDHHRPLAAFFQQRLFGVPDPLQPLAPVPPPELDPGPLSQAQLQKLSFIADGGHRRFVDLMNAGLLGEASNWLDLHHLVAPGQLGPEIDAGEAVVEAAIEAEFQVDVVPFLARIQPTFSMHSLLVMVMRKVVDGDMDDPATYARATDLMGWMYRYRGAHEVDTSQVVLPLVHYVANNQPRYELPAWVATDALDHRSSQGQQAAVQLVQDVIHDHVNYLGDEDFNRTTLQFFARHFPRLMLHAMRQLDPENLALLEGPILDHEGPTLGRLALRVQAMELDDNEGEGGANFRHQVSGLGFDQVEEAKQLVRSLHEFGRGGRRSPLTRDQTNRLQFIADDGVSRFMVVLDTTFDNLELASLMLNYGNALRDVLVNEVYRVYPQTLSQELVTAFHEGRGRLDVAPVFNYLLPTWSLAQEINDVAARASDYRYDESMRLAGVLYHHHTTRGPKWATSPIDVYYMQEAAMHILAQAAPPPGVLPTWFVQATVVLVPEWSIVAVLGGGSLVLDSPSMAMLVVRYYYRHIAVTLGHEGLIVGQITRHSNNWIDLRVLQCLADRYSHVPLTDAEINTCIPQPKPDKRRLLTLDLDQRQKKGRFN